MVKNKGKKLLLEEKKEHFVKKNTFEGIYLRNATPGTVSSLKKTEYFEGVRLQRNKTR